CHAKMSTNMFVNSCEIPNDSMVWDKLLLTTPAMLLSTRVTSRRWRSTDSVSSNRMTTYSSGLGSYTKARAVLSESGLQNTVYFLSGAILRTSKTFLDTVES